MIKQEDITELNELISAICSKFQELENKGGLGSLMIIAGVQTEENSQKEIQTLFYSSENKLNNVQTLLAALKEDQKIRDIVTYSLVEYAKEQTLKSDAELQVITNTTKHNKFKS